ncbi:MAG: pancreas/duodenum homeobox protein 1 [Deltaproteobacteria bacterium]|nr:MAG: pancreas/duodenum homeobox protein 1 [Deltaproteobacteria bacterium]
MNTETIPQILTKENLSKIFPKERSNQFFEALFGDAAEGAYDIELGFRDVDQTTLTLELLLHQRPNCCLACNLTQGLPQVFSRHPIININGVVREIDALLGDDISCGDWSLGHTEQRQQDLHLIPLYVSLSAAE